MNKKNIVTWILFFLAFLLISQFFSKKQVEPDAQLITNKIGITTVAKEYVSEQEVTVKLRNNTTAAVLLPSNCPNNPLKVLIRVGEKFEEKVVQSTVKCELFPDIKLEPSEEKILTFKYWNHSLFSTPGTYKIETSLIGAGAEKEIFSSPEFTITEAGFWRKLFREFFYQPLYNILVFLIDIAPGKSLGFAIILLTILIRLILLVPSQKAIVSQRKMQQLQPKLEHIKKTYAGNQERIGQETMKLWKENKVNPFGSCLPILIQFPVLIALFYVIQNGLNPDNSHLIYSFVNNVDFNNISTNFLGILELTRVNIFVLPLLVGALQFLQLKLAMMKKKTEGKEQAPASEMETANKTMVYIMPVMIAVFTASVPAGVGLYWGISTLFALVQQIVANRGKI